MKSLASGRRAPTVLFVLCVYFAMSAIVLYPIWAVQVPVLSDYLNHLARMHILVSADRSAEIGRYYEVAWLPIPYLAMDATFLVMNQIATIYDAGRLLVGLCLLLPVAGVAALHFAVHRRISLVPAAAFLCCYNYMLTWGFVPYLLGLSFALILFAAWVGTSAWSRWPRAVLFCGLALLVYLSHLVAFGAYGLMIACYEFARAWRAGFRPWRTILADWLAAAIQAVPAGVVLLSFHVDRPLLGPVVTAYGSPLRKLLALLSSLLFFGDLTNILYALGISLLFAAGLLTRCIRLAPALWPVALTVGIVAAATPVDMFGTSGMDLRLPLLAALLLIAATTPTDRLNRAMRGFALAGFLGAAAFHALSVTPTLKALDSQVSEVRHLVAAMPRGQRLLVVELPARQGDLRVGIGSMTWHMAFVATIDRDAFVPYLFTGLSVVRPRPSVLTISSPNGFPISPDGLQDGLMRDEDIAGGQSDGRGGREYWLGWPHNFDYALVMHFGRRDVPLPPHLQLVKTSSIADLYRISEHP